MDSSMIDTRPDYSCSFAAILRPSRWEAEGGPHPNSPSAPPHSKIPFPRATTHRPLVRLSRPKPFGRHAAHPSLQSRVRSIRIGSQELSKPLLVRLPGSNLQVIPHSADYYLAPDAGAGQHSRGDDNPSLRVRLHMFGRGEE